MSSNNSFFITSANSYSQALYELALESEVLDKIEKQSISIVSLISKSDDFKKLIKDPTIKQKTQSEVLSQISEKFNFNELLKKFFNFLVQKRRLFFIEKILKDFLIICSNMRGEISAKLTAAKKLSDTEIAKIKNDLGENFGSNIKLTFKYDPDLIGGLIIQVGSVMIDTSIKNKLQQLENKMVEV